jgi:NADP-dependent 3-hydroxy acid dehydrogenase YdfG
MDSLNGQVAIVTGASQGIGAAVARHLARLGMRLALCARNTRKLEALIGDLSDTAANSLIMPCDVRDAAQVQRVVDETLARFGRIDALVNNAGVAPRVGLLQEMSIEDVNRTLDTNLKGAIYFMRAVLPSMVQRQAGTIININSVAGKTAYPYWSLYDASKFGLRAVTEAVAEEQRGNRIKVAGIYPGAVDTAIWGGLELEHEPGHEGMLRPDVVADAVVYILRQPGQVFTSDITLAPLRPVL